MSDSPLESRMVWRNTLLCFEVLNQRVMKKLSSHRGRQQKKETPALRRSDFLRWIEQPKVSMKNYLRVMTRCATGLYDKNAIHEGRKRTCP